MACPLLALLSSKYSYNLYHLGGILCKYFAIKHLRLGTEGVECEHNKSKSENFYFSLACRVGILKDIIKIKDAAIGLLYSTPLDVWSIIGPS